MSAEEFYKYLIMNHNLTANDANILLRNIIQYVDMQGLLDNEENKYILNVLLNDIGISSTEINKINFE